MSIRKIKIHFRLDCFVNTQIFSSLSDSGFVVLQGTTYWTDLFVRHFLFQAEHAIDGDDLLFFVRKKHVKTSSRYLPKFETEVDVFRKDSKKLPIGDPDIDWEETVYLNLVVHQFDYTLTLAICTRTSPKELQVRIVALDRIREEFKKYYRKSIQDLLSQIDFLPFIFPYQRFGIMPSSLEYRVIFILHLLLL